MTATPIAPPSWMKVPLVAEPTRVWLPFHTRRAGTLLVGPSVVRPAGRPKTLGGWQAAGPGSSHRARDIQMRSRKPRTCTFHARFWPSMRRMRPFRDPHLYIWRRSDSSLVAPDGRMSGGAWRRPGASVNLSRGRKSHVVDALRNPRHLAPSPLRPSPRTPAGVACHLSTSSHSLGWRASGGRS